MEIRINTRVKDRRGLVGFIAVSRKGYTR